jgi:hypothetical protein
VSGALTCARTHDFVFHDRLRDLERNECDRKNTDAFDDL